MYLWFTKRLKWRIRELLELAAAPVSETTNGFTPRPRPLGKVEYSKFELMEFAAFALRNHIAIPYHESDRVGAGSGGLDSGIHATLWSAA